MTANFLGEAPVAALTEAPSDLTPQLKRGDWRKATANIEDAINYHMNGRVASAT